MEARVEQFDPCRMVYMRRIGPYGSENYGLMAAMKDWASGKGLMKPGSVIYGIARDDENTPPEQCRYDVCLVAVEGCPSDESVLEGEIPGGKYVIFTVEHTARAVQKFWMTVLRELERTGYSTDFGRPILERYDYETVERGYCEFCVPVL